MAERKVLIIDDDDALLPMLKTAFKRYKFDVTVTSDGADGLEKARQSQPDLVLLSVELPTGNGFLVCKEFKQDAGLKSVPVIITSRKATEADFEKHRKLKVRADDYLHKPFTDEELFAKVGNVVGFSLSPDEYQELEAKVHDFLEDRHKLEAEISEKAERIAHLEEELAAAKKGGGKSEKQAAEQAKASAEKDERIAALEAEIAEAREAAGAGAKLEKQLAKKDEEIAKLKADVDKLKADAEERKAEIKQLKADQAAKVSALESDLAARDERIGEIEEALAAAKEEAASKAELEARIGELEEDTEAKAARIEALQDDLSRKEAAFTEESAAAKQRAEALEAKAAEAQSALDAVVDAAGTGIDEIRANVGAWREAAARVPALEEDNGRLEGELQSARAHAADLEKTVDKDHKKRAKLREVLEKAIAAID